MDSVVVISCWFGKRFHKTNEKTKISQLLANVKYIVKSVISSKLYSFFKVQSVVPIAPTDCDRAIFFTNNRLLKKEIILKGWEYSFLKDDGLNGIDSIESSLHAKKVKFLQLEQHILDELYTFDYILYVDSRAIVDDIDRIKSFCDKGIVIRYSPAHKNKNSIWDEVNEAKVAERYALSMPETIRFIEDKIKGAGYTHDNKVMATGVILYKIGDKQYQERILSLCKEVYTACVDLHQPECQIIWCLLSQSYDDFISKVNSEDILTRSA